MPISTPFNVHPTGYAAMTNGYDTVPNCAAALRQRDIVANDEVIDLQIHTNQTFTSGFDMYPKTFSAQCYIRVRPATGLGHMDLDTSGALDYGTQGIELSFTMGSGAVRFSHGVLVEGFRLRAAHTNAAGVAIFLARFANSASYPNGVFDATMRRCKILNTCPYTAVDMSNNASNATFEDNIVFNESASGFPVRGYTGSIQRNTFIGRGSGAGRTGMRSGAAGTYRDNVFVGCGGEPLNRATAPAVCENNYADTAITVGSSTGFTVAANLIGGTTDARPAAGSPLIGAGSTYARNTLDARGKFRGTSPDLGAAMLNPAAMPAAPVITVTSVTTLGQKVIVQGTYTGVVDSATATLPVGATPNGAVAKTTGVSFANGSFNTTFTNCIPGNYGAPVVTMQNVSGPANSTGGAPFTLAAPPSPAVDITAQEKNGTTVTISGTTTGYPTSGTITLPAAAVNPGTAATKTGAMVLSDDGTFTCSLTSVASGRYDGPTASVSNYTGSGADTGFPMEVWAAGQQPPGYPAVTLPAYVAPAFNAPTVADGGIVATIQLQNTTASAQTNQPFTLGHPFKEGQLRPQDTLVGKIVGQSDVALQFNVKATHDDGSVRHAMISGVLPTIGASATVSMGLARSTAAGNYAAVPSATAHNAGVRARAEITIGGTLYTARTDDAMLAGVTGNALWLAGPVCTEYLLDVPFKTAANVAHATMTAQFHVRYYSGIGRAKIDIVVEDTNGYASTTDVTYDAKIYIGSTESSSGDTQLEIYNATALRHWVLARYRRTGWWNSNPANKTGAATALHVKVDPVYWIDSKQLPNWDRTAIPHEAAILANLADENGKTYGPMKFGPIQTGFGVTGSRPDIALSPKWHVTWLLSQDKRMYDMMIRIAECGASFFIHRRDRSAGPMAGHPMDVVHWPCATEVGTSGDAMNPATGQSEKYPSKTTTNPGEPDVPHQPAFSYIPYMVTGDYFHLEEMLFWAGWCGLMQNPNYREKHKNMITMEQVRGQAWTMRTWAMCKAILPDAHPLKPSYVYYIDQNLNFYNQTYSTNPNANKLGIITNGGSTFIEQYAISPDGGVTIYKPAGTVKNNIRVFMDDFFTQAIGFAWDLGNDAALPVLRFKAKFPIQRMTAPGNCWRLAGTIDNVVRETASSPIFETMAEVYEATYSPEVLAAACDSAEMNSAIRLVYGVPNDVPITSKYMVRYPDGAESFIANLHPAMSYAVDSGAEGALEAWEVFDQRDPKPDYRVGAQFAVMPRGETVIPPATAITFGGPASGTVGQTSANFTIAANGTLSGSVSVTLSDAGGGGTFSPNPVILTDAARTGYATYTAGSAGGKTLSASNNGGLANPDAVAFQANAAPMQNPPTVSAVTISPASATIAGGGTQQFTAGVVGANNPSQAVTWAASLGSVNASGLYTAPAQTAEHQYVTVTATSVQDTSKSATANIVIPGSAPPSLGRIAHGRTRSSRRGRRIV